MRKLRSLIGMPVLCRRQKLGRLVQAELSPDLRRMEGVWVDCALLGTRYITSDHLSMLGEVAVHSDDRGMRRRCTASPLFCRAASTDGRRIGAVVGAEIDELSFLVTALEITGGVWDDLYTGRSRAEHFTVSSEGRLAMVIVAESDACGEDDCESASTEASEQIASTHPTKISRKE